jgi:hypothetical protein
MREPKIMNGNLLTGREEEFSAPFYQGEIEKVLQQYSKKKTIYCHPIYIKYL